MSRRKTEQPATLRGQTAARSCNRSIPCSIHTGPSGSRTRLGWSNPHDKGCPPNPVFDRPQLQHLDEYADLAAFLLAGVLIRMPWGRLRRPHHSDPGCWIITYHSEWSMSISRGRLVILAKKKGQKNKGVSMVFIRACDIPVNAAMNPQTKSIGAKEACNWKQAWFPIYLPRCQCRSRRT